MRKAQKQPTSQDYEPDYEYQEFCSKQRHMAVETQNKPIVAPISNSLEGVCIYCGNKGYFHTKFGNVSVCVECLKAGKLG